MAGIIEGKKGLYRQVLSSALLVLIGAVLIVALLVAAQTKAQASKAYQTSAGNVENGKQLYLKMGCYACHGMEAQGGRDTGPRLAPNPPPLDFILAYVRRPTGKMPPYTKKVISDDELANIYAFLTTPSLRPDLGAPPAPVMDAQGAEVAVSLSANDLAQTPTSGAQYFDREKVLAAWAKGEVLSISGDEKNYNYRVAIHRQEKPGLAEVHALTTHIIYVLDGSATYVTGGTIIEPKATGKDEIRGSAIAGGVIHHVSKGDVIIVPKGVPHWYKEIKSPFILFMVNIR